MPPDGSPPKPYGPPKKSRFQPLDRSALPQTVDGAETAAGFQSLDIKRVASSAEASDPDMAPDQVKKPTRTRKTGPKDAAPALFGLAARLAKLMTDLTALIAQETALLKTRRPSDAKALHGSKARMIVEYRETIGRLQANQDSLGERDSVVRKYLKSLGETLTATLKDHARVVIRLKSMSEGLIKTVGEEVAKRQGSLVSYGESAQVRPQTSAAPTSLALNELI